MGFAAHPPPTISPTLINRFKQDVENRLAELRDAELEKHKLEIWIIRIEDVARFKSFGPRPKVGSLVTWSVTNPPCGHQNDYYDADVCDWGDEKPLLLGDTRTVTVREAEAQIRETLGLESSVRLWASIEPSRSTNMRRVGAPFEWLNGGSLLAREMQINEHSFGFVLVDDKVRSGVKLLRCTHPAIFCVANADQGSTS